MMNQSKKRGTISVFFGPMFSGKSTSLLNKIEQYESEGKKVLVVNFAHDNRYSTEGELVTHTKKTHKAKKCFLLSEIEDIYQDYDVIAIDEGQFFNDIVDRCDNYAYNGKIVVVAALDATFQRKPFNQILNIVPIADNVQKLQAVCAGCQEPASFSSRKIKSKQIELIGGEDIYEPLCRECFYLKNDAEEQQEQFSDNSSESNLDNQDVKEQKRKNSVDSDNSISTDISMRIQS